MKKSWSAPSFLTLLLPVLLSWHLKACSLIALADDPPPGAPTIVTAGPGVAAPTGEGVPQAAPPAKRYRRSRLTYDEAEDTADRRHLLLTAGEDRAVDLDFDVNITSNGISIGNPALLATTLVKIGDKRQIVFKPLKAGETTVTVRDADGLLRLVFMVRVTGSNLVRVESEIKELLRDIEGLDIRIVGPKVVLEGEVLVPADYGRIYEVINDPAYKGYVLNLTTLSPLGLVTIARKIQDDIQTFAKSVTTRVVNGVIFLEGNVDSIDFARKAAEIAGIYLPDATPRNFLDDDQSTHRSTLPRQLIRNFIVVNPPPPKKQEKLVRVMVHFVELRKDYDKQFGFQWEPGFTANPSVTVGAGSAGGTTANGASFSAVLSSLIPTLNSLETAGFARVLRTGNVVVRSGQAAQLEEISSIPIQAVQSSTGSAVVQAPAPAQVGLSIGVTPVILGQSDDIRLEIKCNQQDLDSTISASGPVTTSHKVETQVYLKSAESAAIAGVNASDIETGYNQAPNPGQFSTSSSSGSTATTSPLFTLVHSKTFNKTKTQFVIFVTPQILDSASEGTEDLKKNFRVKVK
jgi:pilus assembly protein CpaC